MKLGKGVSLEKWKANVNGLTLILIQILLEKHINFFFIASKKSSLPSDYYHFTSHKPTVKKIKVKPWLKRNKQAIRPSTVMSIIQL